MKPTIDELWARMDVNEGQLMAELKASAQEVRDLHARLNNLEKSIRDNLGSLTLLKGAKEIYTILMGERTLENNNPDGNTKPPTLDDYMPTETGDVWQKVDITEEILKNDYKMMNDPVKIPQSAEQDTASSPPPETPRPPGGGGGKKSYTRRDTKETLSLRLEERIRSIKEGVTKGSIALDWLIENLNRFPHGILRKDLVSYVKNDDLNRGEWENASRTLGWWNNGFIIRKDTTLKGFPTRIFTMTHWSAIVRDDPARAEQLTPYEPKEGIHYEDDTEQQTEADVGNENTESDQKEV